MLAILDYGAGNQTSVWRALNKLGVEAKITADPSEIALSSGVIFPGVGAAPQAMDRLNKSGLGAELKKTAARGQPLLGICLGCQILLERSEEGPVETLSLVRGECRRFDGSLKDENGEAVKIPHMGWNGIAVLKPSPLLEGLPADAEFYFVHSYYAVPREDLVIATSRYGLDFCSVYGRDGLWAAQFHPEKSGKPGLRVLRNFASYCGEKNAAL